MVLALTLTLVLALTLALAHVPERLMNYLEYENGHETDRYKAKKRIDDMNLHKKTRRIQLE